MDTIDATIAIGLIGDYWPGRALNDQQTVVWAASLVRTGATFDATCEAIAAYAGTDPRPPTLAHLCSSIRVRPAVLAPSPLDRPPTTARGRAWAGHLTALSRHIGTRLEAHNHHHGWQNCPVCTGPLTVADISAVTDLEQAAR